MQLDEKKKKLEEDISQLEQQNTIGQKLSEANLEMNLEKEKININKKMETELQEKINQLNIEKRQLEENKKDILLKNQEIKNRDREKIKNKKIK